MFQQSNHFFISFRDDQPPWYHSNWPELHPTEMDTHQLITYLVENVLKYRPRIPAASQYGSLGLNYDCADFFCSFGAVIAVSAQWRTYYSPYKGKASVRKLSSQ